MLDLGKFEQSRRVFPHISHPLNKHYLQKLTLQKKVWVLYLGPEGLQLCLEFNYFFFTLNQLSLCLLLVKKLLIKLKSKQISKLITQAHTDIELM